MSYTDENRYENYIKFSLLKAQKAIIKTENFQLEGLQENTIFQ